MARSSYIYIVEHPHQYASVGFVRAFTVKHEMLSWLARYTSKETQIPKDELEVYRVRDNQRDYFSAKLDYIPRVEWMPEVS